MHERMQIEAVASEVVDSCLAVHRALGPGLLESIYQQCLVRELQHRELQVATEVEFPVIYRGAAIDTHLRVDMIVAGLVVVENKAVQGILPVHEAQLLTYLKLSNLRIGFLVNWNVPLIREGIRRMVNKL